MVDFDTREGIMKEWDRWVSYLRSGGGGTWPRDAFESLLDYLEEQRHLTSSSSRAADACSCHFMGDGRIEAETSCPVHGVNPPPA